MTVHTDRLQYPFDQYQRYDVAARLLPLTGIEPGSTVLDVGGASGPADVFFADYDVTVADVVEPAADTERFILASGDRLPFEDQAFDAVLSQDTLEHVAAPDRPGFLSEVLRVASRVAILCAPFASPEVELAEQALSEFVRSRFGGFPTLDEHSEHGLPDLVETVRVVSDHGWSTAVLPSGYLPRWLTAMLVHHELLATGLPKLEQLHAFYNATVSPYDCRSPSYRHVIVAARGQSPANLDQSVRALQLDEDPSAQSSLRALAQTVFSQRLQSVLNAPSHEQLEELKAQAANLRAQIADREAHILELRSQVDDLTNRLQATGRTLYAASRDKLMELRSRRRESG